MSQPSEDDETRFRDYYAKFEDYPRDLIRCPDRKKLVQACARYHACHAPMLFRTAGSDTWVVIQDYGIEGEDAPATGNHRTRWVKHEDQLVSELRWPSTGSAPCRTPSSSQNSTVAPADLPCDPRSRFIIIESPSCQASHLSLTSGLLFKILAYYQVSPHYLKLLTAFSYPARASDPNLGCISFKKFFRHRGPKILNIGRSGHHFQLTFQLTSFLEDNVKSDGRPTWSRYRAAVYHHFDVVEGRSCWIFTAPLRPVGSVCPLDTKQEARNDLWANVQEATHKKFADAVERRQWFAASLDVFLALGEWAWGDWGFYLHELGENIMKTSSEYIDTDIPVATKDLQLVNYWLFRLTECQLRLEGNLSVLRSIRDFYNRQLVEETRQIGPAVDWLEDCKGDIDAFVDQINLIMQSTDDLLRKAKQIYEQGRNRETYMQKLLQNQVNDVMKVFSELNRREASVMRVLQFIAVIFLPVTVVSAVFSTDIVKFQDLPDGQTSRFSPTALWTWFLTTILLTGTTMLAWMWFSRKDPRRLPGEVAEERTRGL